MKITIDIGGNDYTFELNRITYKRLLADKEYAEMQNQLSKRVAAKNANSEDELTKLFEDDLTSVMLSNLIMEEQVFYYSLLCNHPDMTKEQANELIDLAYLEYGREAVSELTSKLLANFSQREDQPKKKMVMRFS
jgi:hypothetical protein